VIVAGCDVGSLTGKAVIMEDGKIISSSIILRTVRPEETAKIVLDNALSRVSMKAEEIKYLVGTGYGRLKIPFANTNISEITCHGRGAHWLVPSVRTILDIGGQDSKVISLADDGYVANFQMNDKCAAGTGRFLEGIARALELGLEELGPISLKSNSPSVISSQCSVFADSEVVSLLADGVAVEDIVAGVHKAIASRLISLVKKVGVKKDFTVTGGVAKNIGVVKFLEEGLGELKSLPEDPQLVGAIGAAVIAKEKAEKQK
jgi:predicted CoA-substrate-specific enzyme activase